MKANVLGSVRCLPARTVPRDERGGDVSLVHERLDVRIDGVASFERWERAAVNRRQRHLRSFPSESPTGRICRPVVAPWAAAPQQPPRRRRLGQERSRVDTAARHRAPRLDAAGMPCRRHERLSCLIPRARRTPSRKIKENTRGRTLRTRTHAMTRYYTATRVASKWLPRLDAGSPLWTITVRAR